MRDFSSSELSVRVHCWHKREKTFVKRLRMSTAAKIYIVPVFLADFPV